MKKKSISLLLTLSSVLCATAWATPAYHLRVSSPGMRAALPAVELPTATLTGQGNFGQVIEGQSQSVLLTLTNSSAQAQLTVSSIAISGAAVSRAGVDSCPTSFPAVLAAASSCTISATWAPASAGSLTGAMVTVQDNAGTSPQQIALTGTAVAPSDPYFANVIALLPFDGGGDVKGNALTMVGNASVSTAQKHSGSGSAYFDPTGDAIKINTPALFDFPGDFTIEGYVYPLSSQASHVFSIGGVDQLTWQSQSLWIGGGQFVYTASSANNGADIAPSTSIGAANIGAWNHFAVTRNGGVYRTFINGKMMVFNVNKKPYTPQYGFLLGNYPLQTWTNFPSTWGTQYIDNVRVTKGVARYTAEFTPSNKAFPTH